MSATAKLIDSLLPVATGVATTVVEQSDPGLLTKAQNVVASVEHDAETFFTHNTALQPLAQDIVQLVLQEGEEHVPSIMSFLGGLLPLFAKQHASTVTLPAVA